MLYKLHCLFQNVILILIMKFEQVLYFAMDPTAAINSLGEIQINIE